MREIKISNTEIDVAAVLMYLYPKLDPERDWLVTLDRTGYTIKWFSDAAPPDIRQIMDAWTSEEFRLWRLRQHARKIDFETGARIRATLHSRAGMDENLGILRDQLVHVLNALGIEPTPEFARLNEIAIKAIEAARKKKEALNAQDNTA